MNMILMIVFFVLIFYSFTQFARQEHFQEGFEDAVIDIEGRLARISH